MAQRCARPGGVPPRPRRRGGETPALRSLQSRTAQGPFRADTSNAARLPGGVVGVDFVIQTRCGERPHSAPGNTPDTRTVVRDGRCGSCPPGLTYIAFAEDRSAGTASSPSPRGDRRTDRVFLANQQLPRVSDPTGHPETHDGPLPLNGMTFDLTRLATPRSSRSVALQQDPLLAPRPSRSPRRRPGGIPHHPAPLAKQQLLRVSDHTDHPETRGKSLPLNGMVEVPRPHPLSSPQADVLPPRRRPGASRSTTDAADPLRTNRIRRPPLAPGPSRSPPTTAWGHPTPAGATPLAAPQLRCGEPPHSSPGNTRQTVAVEQIGQRGPGPPGLTPPPSRDTVSPVPRRAHRREATTAPATDSPSGRHLPPTAAWGRPVYIGVRRGQRTTPAKARPGRPQAVTHPQRQPAGTLPATGAQATSFRARPGRPQVVTRPRPERADALPAPGSDNTRLERHRQHHARPTTPPTTGPPPTAACRRPSGTSLDQHPRHHARPTTAPATGHPTRDSGLQAPFQHPAQAKRPSEPPTDHEPAPTAACGHQPQATPASINTVQISP